MSKLRIYRTLSLNTKLCSDPTLFTGTIRSNLDPFSLFTDEEIFTALRRVQLIGNSAISTATGTPTETPGSPISIVSRERRSISINPADRLGTSHDASVPATTNPASLAPLAEHDNDMAITILDAAPMNDQIETGSPPLENKNVFQNLNSPVTESGLNLSQGQRQLLCLARALLKSPKVLLMDEATASIDYATDAKIQDTIRELKNNTILTIAHRLKTIIDYDKVIVMDKGAVVECDSPWELINKKEGQFREMCKASGDEWDDLQKLAKKAWESKRLVDDS